MAEEFEMINVSDATGENKKVDVCLVIDTTASMQPHIDAVEKQIHTIVDTLHQGAGYDVMVQVIAYRDLCDAQHTYLTRVSGGFTDDIEALHMFVESLTAQGGGDQPEAVAEALQKTLESDWREDAAKIAVLITDAAPHGINEVGDSYPDGTDVDPIQVVDEMVKKGITLYVAGAERPLLRTRHGVDFYASITKKTGGKAVGLDQAAELANVILGGAIEEQGLVDLAARVESMRIDMQKKHPEWEESKVNDAVFRSLSDEGVLTPVYRTNEFSPSTDAFEAVTSLKEARMKMPLPTDGDYNPSLHYRSLPDLPSTDNDDDYVPMYRGLSAPTPSAAPAVGGKMRTARAPIPPSVQRSAITREVFKKALGRTPNRASGRT